MKTYVTKAGDLWDWIAYRQMGSTRFTEKLINANRKHIETFIFKAGVELIIPEVDTAILTRLPPWRR